MQALENFIDEYNQLKRGIDALRTEFGDADLEGKKGSRLKSSALYMDFLAHITGKRTTELGKYIDECSDWLTSDEQLKADFKKLAGHSSDGVATGEIRVHSYTLFVMVRALRPELFLETGVANGKSSLMILEAMDRNKNGRLVSVDAATIDSTGIDRHKAAGADIGWLVPRRLRQRWDLRIGFSSAVLPALTKYDKKIDIFMHDSLSNYENMTFEYGQALRLLKPGAILMSDDIETCNAFKDFSSEHARAQFCFGTLGVMFLKES